VLCHDACVRPKTAITSLSAQGMREERNQEENNEKEEQQFGDSRSGHGNSREAKDGGDQSHDEKSQCVAKHISSFFVSTSSFK
jgi:hypothetical protein